MQLSLDSIRRPGEKIVFALACVFSSVMWIVLLLGYAAPFYMQPVAPEPCVEEVSEGFYTDTFNGYFPVSPYELENYFAAFDSTDCIDEATLPSADLEAITGYYKNYSDVQSMCILPATAYEKAEPVVTYNFYHQGDASYEYADCMLPEMVPKDVWINATAEMQQYAVNPGIAIAFLLLGVTFYIAIIGTVLFLAVAISMAHIRINAIQLSPDQHKKLYEVYHAAAQALQMKSVPTAYVVDMDGSANAFAIKIVRKRMVVFFSEAVQRLLEDGKYEELKAIAAHELAHVHLRHTHYHFFLLPFRAVPFLALWLSRIQEYSADRAALFVVKDVRIMQSALAKLVLGTYVTKNINIEDYIVKFRGERGFIIWLAKLLSTHPPLPARMAALQQLEKE